MLYITRICLFFSQYVTIFNSNLFHGLNIGKHRKHKLQLLMMPAMAI